jgi:adenylate cyclase
MRNLDALQCCRMMDEATASATERHDAIYSCLKIVIDAFDCDRGFILAHDQRTNMLNVLAAHKLEPDSILTTAEVSQTIISTVLDEEKSVITSNALEDPRFSETSSVVISGLRSVLSVPISTDKGVIGLIYVDNRLRKDVFTQHHRQFLEVCAMKLSQIILRLYPDIRPKARK